MSGAAYEEILDEQMPGGKMHYKAPTQPILQQDVIYDQLDDQPPHMQTALPPNETLYDDTVFLTEEQKTVLPSTSSTKPHPYDHIDNRLDSTAARPPQDKRAYTNTLPGKITPKALSHYDLGQ